MNSKKAKQIRRHAKQLMLEWLRSVVSDEEAKKVDIKNIQDYVPDQTHIYANKSLRVSVYTLRWFAQGIKKIIRSKQKRIKDITVEDITNT